MRAGPMLSTVAALLVAATIPAMSQDFYAGKRLTILINYAAGGPADVEGRLFARHFAKHIAGDPTVLVQNMDGAGGLVGTNFLGEVAPKDGTMVGLLTGSAWSYVVDPQPRRVDFKSYEFVSYQPGTTVYFARSDIRPGLKDPTDFARVEGVISGGLGVATSKDMLLRLTLEMLGHKKYKYVTGYRGSAAARLAMQQGEINYYSESAPSYRSIVEPGMVRKGEAIGLFYDPPYDGRSFGKSKQVEGLPLLPFHELYRKIKGDMPSGQLWDAYRTIIAVNGTMLRMMVLPPGAPKAAIEALRAATVKLGSDKEFIEECVRTFGYVPEIEAGPDVPDKVRSTLAVTAETKAFMAAYIEAGTSHK